MALWHRATGIVKMKEGILLVEHVFPRKFGLPGGRIKSGEKWEEAMRRELLEEIGLRVRKVKYLFSCRYWHQNHRVFLIEAEGKIKTNWELVDYGFLGEVDESKMGLLRKLFWRNIQREKVFNENFLCVMCN